MNVIGKLKRVLGSPQPVTPASRKAVTWEKPYQVLRDKWVEVPITNWEILKTTDLLTLPDDALLAKWEETRAATTTGAEFSHRGWYHVLYAEAMRGKKVMDIGSGFGIDSITFAEHGARVTFVDIVKSNLEVLKRLCQIKGLKDVQFHFFEDLSSLRALHTDYDVIMAMGSLHNAPAAVMKPEYQELLRHLRRGGRWLQLAYPKSLWIQHGSLPFDLWGQKLECSPWEEWYDMPKLLSMFEPSKFEVVLYHEFHNGDFNWFDLLYRGK